MGVPPLLPPPDPAKQTQELLKFLREESEANRKSVREDSEASRELLLSTIKIVAIPVAVALAIGAWLGYRSVNDLKETLEHQATTATQAAIAHMQDDVHKRLTEQFETPALQKMVKETAAEYTKTQAEPLIKIEVANQVKSRVDAQRPAIAATVAQQTQMAVKQMGEDLRKRSFEEVATEVKAQVDSQKPTIVAAVAQQTQVAVKQFKEDLSKQTLKVGSLESAGPISATRPGPSQVAFGMIGCSPIDDPSAPFTFCAQGAPPSLFQYTPASGLRPVSSFSPAGFQDVSTAAKPTCTEASRGTFYVEKGTGKLADKPFLCVKKANNSYDWTELAMLP